jgi:hypothetical protein
VHNAVLPNNGEQRTIVRSSKLAQKLPYWRTVTEIVCVVMNIEVVPRPEPDCMGMRFQVWQKDQDIYCYFIIANAKTIPDSSSSTATLEGHRFAVIPMANWKIHLVSVFFTVGVSGIDHSPNGENHIIHEDASINWGRWCDLSRVEALSSMGMRKSRLELNVPECFDGGTPSWCERVAVEIVLTVHMDQRLNSSNTAWMGLEHPNHIFLGCTVTRSHVITYGPERNVFPCDYLTRDGHRTPAFANWLIGEPISWKAIVEEQELIISDSILADLTDLIRQYSVTDEWNGRHFMRFFDDWSVSIVASEFNPSQAQTDRCVILNLQRNRRQCDISVSLVNSISSENWSLIVMISERLRTGLSWVSMLHCDQRLVNIEKCCFVCSSESIRITTRTSSAQASRSKSYFPSQRHEMRRNFSEVIMKWTWWETQYCCWIFPQKETSVTDASVHANSQWMIRVAINVSETK